MLVGLDLPSADEGTEAGVLSPHQGNSLSHSETADLWQSKWNKNQTVLAIAIHTLGSNAGPLEGTAAGSWSLGLWSNPRARAAVDCRKTDQGDVREEIVVGNACGGKSGSHGIKVILLSHV